MPPCPTPEGAAVRTSALHPVHTSVRVEAADASAPCHGAASSLFDMDRPHAVGFGAGPRSDVELPHAAGFGGSLWRR